MRIKDTYENTIVIQKSEFITRLFRVNSIEEVEEKLAYVRKKHYDARHNCYAYILGDNQEIQKASDDGEPSKTAGAPMLDVLKKNKTHNSAAGVRGRNRHKKRNTYVFLFGVSVWYTVSHFQMRNGTRTPEK